MLAGSVFVYGGRDASLTPLASVEMLSISNIFGLVFKTLPTPMFKPDWHFASVLLP